MRAILTAFVLFTAGGASAQFPSWTSDTECGLAVAQAGDPVARGWFLGNYTDLTANPDLAESHYGAMLDCVSERRGRDSDESLYYLQRLAMAQQAQGKRALALETITRARTLSETKHGLHHPTTRGVLDRYSVIVGAPDLSR